MTMSTVAVARPATPADETAIGETVADYYLGWYDADPAPMARALHPSLAKRGWDPAAGGAPDVDEDTFATMVEYTRRGLGRRGDEGERRFELRGLTVYGDIASVNVFAVPYVDLLQLVRTSEGWRIVNALWCRA